MPYRVEAVVPRFYRSQTRDATHALGAGHDKYAPDAVEREKRLYLKPDDPDYDEELTVLSSWRNGLCRPVDPELLPKRLYLKIDDPPLLDFYWPTRAGHAFVASGRLRGLIEAREPGVHQFVPVELATAKGTSVADPYFFLVNQRCAFGVGLERSEAGLQIQVLDDFRVYRFPEPKLHASKKTFDPQANLALAPTLVLRRDVAGGLHLWREVAVGIGKGFAYDDKLGLFMSDALFADVMAKGLQGLAATHRGVFDTEVGQ